MFFLRKSSLERLPVAMSGVRTGDRVLQIGVADASLVGAIAAKVGLSGHAAVAVADQRQADGARAAAAAAGALADIQTSTLEALPFSSDSFDVVVLHAGGVARSLADAPGVAMLRDSHRVLRGGGRIVVIEGRVRGLLARFRAPRPADSGTALHALATAGFRAARLLAEREGYRFLEAVKGHP
jgi:ubiquinone/menaquinone biosynthesis C-methylase UbiE